MVFWGSENHLTFEQDCNLLRSLGFGIELWPNAGSICSCRYERKNWSRLKHATEGMLVSLRSRNDYPTIEQWSEQIECAKILNANIVMDLRSFGAPEGSEINGCDISRQIIKMAQDNDVKLCLETGELKKLLQLARKFPALTFCLDAGFVYTDKEHSFREYIDKLAPKITHLHLSDNYGSIDDHRPPGLPGGIPKENWDYLLEAISKYDNEITVSLEMCPPAPAVMIHQASEFLFQHLNWPNKPKKIKRLSNIIHSKK
jgi:sugar phosphate isomerase/epimerase